MEGISFSTGRVIVEILHIVQMITQTSLTTLFTSAALATLSHASVTAFTQTFYSTNIDLTSPSNNVVWATPSSINGEIHTHFSSTAVSIGETLTVSFNIAFNEPQGDGGNNGTDGVRFGLLNLNTLSSMDGVHNSTTGTGYSTRFNWTTGTNATGGDIRKRTAAGNSVNYLTTSSVYGGANNINGFGLSASGTAYDASYSVSRIAASETRVDFTINGITRSFTDTGTTPGAYNTFTFAKIGDTAPFMESSTFTLSSFDVAVVPEPSAFGLIGCSALGLLLRRKR